MKQQNEFIRVNKNFCKCIEVTSDFYRNWLMLINTFFGMTYREIDVAALLLEKYVEIRKKVTDENIANSILFSTETRKKIKEQLALKGDYFDVLLNKLRKHNVIIGNKINEKILPKFNGNNFVLLIAFNNGKKENRTN